MLSRLQYISQGKSPEEHLEHIQRVLDMGIRWIQLRLKNQNTSVVTEVAEKVRIYCTSYDAVFILNDFPQIARLTEADGVHLGLMDMPVAQARKIVGPGKIIGGTANTLEDVLMRVVEKCDYVGLGPFRLTLTKEKLSPVLGLEGYTKILGELQSRNIQIPVFAIGGITPTDMESLMKTGIYGVAVSGILSGPTATDEFQLLKRMSHVDA